MTEIQLYQPEMISTLEGRLSMLKTHFEGIKSSDKDDILESAAKAYAITLKDFKEQRMPITKRFDEIKSQFTALENEIQDCIDQVKNRRNVLAKIEYEKKRIEEERLNKERLEAEAKINAESEAKIEAIKQVAIEVNQWKIKIVKALMTVTTENYQAKLKSLQNIQTTIQSDSDIDITEFVKDKEDFKQQAINEIGFIKDMPIDQKESYLNKFIAEIKEITEQTIEAKEYIESHNLVVKQAEIVIDSIANSQDIKTPNAIKIQVQNKAAYKSLVAYWFEVVFPDYAKEIGTKTINSMILDLERHAKQTGKRLDIVGVKYVDEFKIR